MLPKYKWLIEILLTPLIITIVGSVFTYFITKQQTRSAEICAQAQIKSAERQAKSDQQMKLLDIFSEKITSHNEEEQKMAVEILYALDSGFAQILAEVVLKSIKDSTVRDIASGILKESYVIVAAYHDLAHAKTFAIFLSKYNLKYAIDIYQTEQQVYVVTLGGPHPAEDAPDILKSFSDITRETFKDTYIGIRKGKWTKIHY